MNAKIVYKVVSKLGGNVFGSAIRNSSRVVEYKVGQLAQPKQGENPFLWVFDTLENAKAFRTRFDPNHCTHAIMRGIGIRVRVRAYGTLSFSPSLRRFEAKKIKYQGTMFCDSFIPLKVIG